MKYFLLTLALAFTISSCRGPEGPVGPKGDDGYQYDYTTFIYTVNPSDWQEFENGSGLFYDVSAPEITYDILDYGMFLTYLNTGTEENPIYYEMPQTLVKTDGDGITYSEEIYASYSKDFVRVEYYDTHPVAKFAPAEPYLFRTVIISDPYIIISVRNKTISTDYNSIMKAIETSKTDTKSERVE